MFLLRLYRRIPRSVRTRVRAAIPVALQRRLTRMLATRGPGSRLQPPTRREEPGTRVRVRHAGDHVLAQVCTRADPATARRHHLDAVVTAFAQAGVEYFCVPGEEIRSRVAVPAHDQESALQALHTAPGLAGFYRWPVDHHGRRLHSGPRMRGRPREHSGPRMRGRPREHSGVRLGDRDHQRLAAVRVFAPVTDPTTGWVLGHQFRCTVEFWHERPDGTLSAPRPGRFDRVPAADPPATAPDSVFSRYAGDGPGNRYRTRRAFALPRADHVEFPVDVVYTWVDGGDPQWRRRKHRALGQEDPDALHSLAANDSRYANREELRYSMRALSYFAPWVRRIYLVTDDQLPPWLDLSHPQVTLVRHRDIFVDTGMLPTFNSHAIEAHLHRIPGLAEHFLYFNDDMFLGCPVPPHTFFHANGLAKFFASPAQVDPGPATVDDPPVLAAAKNNRQQLVERFGRTITQKMRHVPYPLRRSVLAEIEQELPAAVKETGQHRFRHPADLAVPSSLAHYWAYLTRRAVPGSIRYVYADLGHPYTALQLHRLLRRRVTQVFCLNDTESGTLSGADPATDLVDRFLSAYFPFPAPFEYPEETVRQRAEQGATALAAAAAGHTTEEAR